MIISGRVQGVNFRFYTFQKARLLGLNGFVRNLPDDIVEAVFEGNEEKVKEMIEWCRHGPAFAKVDNIKIIKEKYKGEFKKFDIL